MGTDASSAATGRVSTVSTSGSHCAWPQLNLWFSGSASASLPHDGNVFEDLVSLTDRWNLVGLRQELSSLLADVDETQRAYVPNELLRVLDMTLDSYGPERWTEQDQT
jgi:hypothetical protein